MTAAFTHAKMAGAKKGRVRLDRQHLRVAGDVRVARPRCRASSSSAAARSPSASCRRRSDYGALTLQIQGDFDDCLRRIRQIAVGRAAMGIYLMNSVNPFRLEGQKSIMLRILEARDWEPAGLDHRARREPRELLPFGKAVHGNERSWGW
jgi:threonine synthase